MLSYQYIIQTLKLIKGCGDKSVFNITQYIFDNGLKIGSLQGLHAIVTTMKQNKTLKRFPDLELEDFEEAATISERIIQRSKDEGIGMVCYYDENYPEMLRNTVDEAGKPAIPLLLYYKGDLSIAHQTCLAVIGTREVTPMGEKAGLYLSREFARRGVVITSGLALGCDTCGHKGALDVEGKTIAFLAHGLDTIYPAENKQLADDIVSHGGLLLSEYPIGTGVNRYNLVARDRLQAGLSKAILVIQTGIKGGTMHAANTALMSGKPLYTIWFNDEATREHEKSKGNEYLVNHGAKYIRGNDNIDKVIEEFENHKCPKERRLFD